MFYREKDWETTMGEIAVSGNDIWMRSLPYHTQHLWVKGNFDGKDIVVPATQYLGWSGNFVVFLFARDSKNIIQDEVRLIYDEERNCYELEPDITLYFGRSKMDKEVEHKTLTLEPFVFDEVTPKTPTNLEYDSDANLFKFQSALLSVDENDLLRDLFFYRFYLDGVLLEFKESRYPFLQKDMTDIPYNLYYYDPDNGCTWGGGNNMMPTYIYLREKGFNKIGVQQVYKYKDKECCSGIAELVINETPELPASNVAITEPLIPSVLYPGKEFTVTARFENNGEADITSLEFTLKIDGYDGLKVTKEYLPYYPFAPKDYKREKLKFTLDFDCNGKNSYKFYVSAVNGVPTSAEGAITGKMTCLASGFDRNLVYEGILSQTSGYCPVGEYGIEKMTGKYGDKGFIGICTHIGGDMDVYEEGAYSFWDGNTATPTSILNRSTVSVYPDVNNLTESYNEQIALPAVGSISATLSKLTDDGREIKVDTESKFLFSEKDAAYTVGYVVVENNVGPYQQLNSFSGASYDYDGFQNMDPEIMMTYNNVARNCSDPFPVDIVLPAVIEKEQIYPHSFEADLTDVTDLNNYKVIVLLLDTQSGEIVNAAYAVPSGLNDVETIGENDTLRVYGGNGTLTLLGANPATICNATGEVIASGIKNRTLNLQSGLYIVTDGSRAVKVLVK